MYKPRIVNTPERRLVGFRTTMSLAEFNIAELWGRFMPRRQEISGQRSGHLISMTLYPAGYFERLDTQSSFEKWATMEVSNDFKVPCGMDEVVIPSGLYALFLYNGPSSDRAVFQYIFNTWLPGSGYELDDRPHYEILGENYRNNHPESEEEIWIPIREVHAK